MSINKLDDPEAGIFKLLSRPNRSLTPAGRMLWLSLMAITTFLVAVAAFAMGAWLILPFAGLEVAVMWYAFRIIALHDEDYEMLTVSETSFKWEQRCGHHTALLEGNRHWATFAAVNTMGNPELRLSYAGKTIVVGTHFVTEQRKQLAKRLQTLFR